MTHEELCERARRWLRGTRRCNPVYSRNASCTEIPDAIGWSSAYGWHGSTVIECKISLGDFYADKKKRIAWEDPKHMDWPSYRGSRIAWGEAQRLGYVEVAVSLMGDFRFYLCDGGLLTADLVEKHAPDHGLLWRDGRSIRIMRPAPRRQGVDKDSEIRYLRFAIINRKNSYEIQTAPAAQLCAAPERKTA